MVHLFLLFPYICRLHQRGKGGSLAQKLNLVKKRYDACESGGRHARWVSGGGEHEAVGHVLQLCAAGRGALLLCWAHAPHSDKFGGSPAYLPGTYTRLRTWLVGSEHAAICRDLPRRLRSSHDIKSNPVSQ